MQEFAEEYVANLQAREERYDTRLGDDFYVSTFPNGIKTWIFLYEVNGFTRRQTLGVYPEMPLEKALETLYAARRTHSVEQQLMEEGLDGNNLVRQAEDSPIDLTARSARRVVSKIPRPGKGFMLGAATGGVAGAVLAGGLAWLLLPVASPGEVRLASVATPAETPPAAELTVQAVVQEPPVPVAGPSGDAMPVAAVLAEPVAQAPVVKPADTGPDSPATGEATDTALAPQTLGDSQRELMELQRDMAGTLAWSQLTSGIVRGEPVDDLGWIVDLSSEPRRVFFFVRVRGMSGSTVDYRWSFEGAVVKRDSVRVGEGWHSPAFSSMTLTPEREGAWLVEVMDSEGRSLGVEQFETRLDRVAALTRR